MIWMCSLNHVGRVLLMIGDYPNFEVGDFETLRFQAFEIWPREERHYRFREIMTNYYQKIYLEHRKGNPNKTPAPKNFWPYSYQFYICNPIQTFSCTVTKANTKPKISIDLLVDPSVDRSKIESVPLPTSVLTDNEILAVVSNLSFKEIRRITTRDISPAELKQMSPANMREIIPFIPEKHKHFLSLRDTDKISTSKKKYSRRKNS
jgi:hypothetical protein